MSSLISEGRVGVVFGLILKDQISRLLEGFAAFLAPVLVKKLLKVFLLLTDARTSGPRDELLLVKA